MSLINNYFREIEVRQAEIDEFKNNASGKKIFRLFLIKYKSN